MSIRYTIRHNIPADKLAAEDVNDSSTWDLDLLRKHELAETNEHDIVYRQHDGRVVNWAEAATQQAQQILTSVQGISADIDEQVQAVEMELAEVEATAVTLTQEAEEANEAAQAALTQAQVAVTDSQSNAQSSRDSYILSRDWARKTDGKVKEAGTEIDYSSKYYAQQSASSASSASTSAATASNAKNDAITAKNSAESSATSASQSATSASTSATTATTKAGEASASATTASTKASEASTSATNAAASATSAASSATSASGSASDAATSETNAGLSATAAATSATSAAASATNAATSETNAATSESNASASASDAEDAKDAAEEIAEEIRDIKNFYGVPVGFEYFSMNPNVPQGSLPLLGGVYSRETYADLWAWVQEQTGYLKTEAEWQSLSTANNGNVPYYSSGDGSTTFRVPSLHCWIKGSDGSAQLVGSYLQAGLPNITGALTFSVSDSTGSGSLGVINGGTVDKISVSHGANTAWYTDFDASRSSSIYGNSSTVQPESIVGMWLVKCYGTVADTGTIDEQAYIDEQLALNVPVGCVQAYAGQTTPQGWLLCDGSAISRTQYNKLFGVIGTSYGAGDGASTFNLPNLTDKFIQGNAVAGTEHSAGLPNITGKVGSVINTGSTGAFYSTTPTESLPSGSYMGTMNVEMDASRSSAIYGNSNTVQPPSVTMRYIIKY